jgi:hypothetical protein
MSFAEVKQEIIKMTPQERDELAAYLFHVRRRDDPEWRAELAKRNQEMDAGRKASEEEVLRVHEELKEQGQ